MNRYRIVAERDEPSMTEGDDSFVGVNEWDAPENLSPGQVQNAVNIDFTTTDASTRGGFVCLPSLGNAPFQSASIWTSRTSAADLSWMGIAYGNGRFVAVASTGTGNRVMTSADGVSWSSQTSAADNDWRAVTYGAGLFVAVAITGTGNRVMTSPDGVSWTSRTSAADNDWRGIAYGNGLFVAVSSNGSSNRVMTSTDGISWTIRTTPNQSWTSVAYGGGTWVAVSTSDYVMTSTDGISWTQRTAVTGSLWSSVAFGAATFVAVGLSGTTRVMTSPDGVSWTARTAVETNSWNSVAFGNNIFVAVADSGTSRIMTSPNGVTWTAAVAPVNNQWRAVANGNNVFAAVAMTGTGDRAMTSGAASSVFASGVYSDPNDPGSQWIVLVGQTALGFYRFGRTSRSIAYESGLTVTEQATVRQCNNKLYIFRGSDETPLYWDGYWGNEVTEAPTPTLEPGFSAIPNSNQAVYAQNRLWVKSGKDTIAASDVLDFDQYDDIANSFNLNTGDSDFLVTTYPFGTTTLLVFKNKSILALTNIEGSLSDVVATEITRQVGCIGINAVVSVGPDVVYMSDRNVNLISLTETNNSLQHKTLPLSRNIRRIIERVNWQYAYKVSMAYYDNKLFVALPLDNATGCNAVCVYNFVTENWYGEWTFDSLLGMSIQGWVVADYLGVARLHCITDDGRIYVVGEGQNDISGTIVAEISTSLTTRAYVMDNANRINRRLYLDLATNRPSFSVTAYSEGANEYTQVLANQTFSRSQSWKFNDSTYTLTNANDDYNRAYRKDYSTGPNSIQCGASGFLPEMEQEYRLPIITRRQGRLAWLKVTNTTGLLRLMSAGFEARAGARSNLIQI